MTTSDHHSDLEAGSIHGEPLLEPMGEGTTNTNIDNFGNLRNFCVMYFQTVIAVFPYALLIVSIVCHLLIQVLFQCV